MDAHPPSRKRKTGAAPEGGGEQSTGASSADGAQVSQQEQAVLKARRLAEVMEGDKPDKKQVVAQLIPILTRPSLLDAAEHALGADKRDQGEARDCLEAYWTQRVCKVPMAELELVARRCRQKKALAFKQALCKINLAVSARAGEARALLDKFGKDHKQKK